MASRKKINYISIEPTFDMAFNNCLQESNEKRQSVNHRYKLTGNHAVTYSAGGAADTSLTKGEN